jgi:hypothetical protein
MPSFFVALALIFVSVASAGTYLVLDGSGHALNRVVADPAFAPGPGLHTAPDDGRALWTPVQPEQSTTLSTLQFLRRFTAVERAAVRASSAAGDVTMLLAASQEVDVTDPATVAGMAGLVALGLITEPRRVQILDLTRVSP